MMMAKNRIASHQDDTFSVQVPGLSLGLPSKVVEAVSNFLLDEKTGNIVLNVKDGVVKCVRAEEIIPIS